MEHALNEANKPIWFHLENPVTPFIGRKAELSELKWGLLDHPVTVITGPRGMGKSELAKKYAQEVKHDNTTNILWLDSRSHESLINSFKDLAVQIGNKLEEKTMTSILRETFDFFHDRKTVFILDHANSDNIIIKNLQAFLNNKAKKVNVVVTSRDEDWGETYKIVKLPPFTKENAVEYTRVVLTKEINIPIVDSSVELLADLLKHLPLALNKATEYIIHKNTVMIEGQGQYTIEDYIQDLQKLQVTAEPPTASPEPIDDETIMDKIKQETENAAKKIETEAKNAWETITDESGRTWKSISGESDRFGRRVSDEAARWEKSVKDFFSFG